MLVHKMRSPASQRVNRESSVNLELTRSGIECRDNSVTQTLSFDGKSLPPNDSEPEDLPD